MTEEAASNYSIDMLKRAAFIAEVSDLEAALKSGADPLTQMIITYLKDRVNQLEAKYKKAS